MKRLLDGWSFIIFVGLALSVLVPGVGVSEEAKPEMAKPSRIIATDYPSLEAAVEAARDLGVPDIFIPAGTYTIKKTLNFTSGPAERPRAFRITGSGGSTVLVANTGDSPALDFTGSCRIIMENMVIQTPIDEKGAWKQGANVGILLARVKGDASSGHDTFRNVFMQGNYSTACVYSYCTEENTFDHCSFMNEGGDAFILTGLNKHGVKSPYQELGHSTNVVASFFFPWFFVSKEGSVGLRLSYTSDIYILSGFFAGHEKAFADIYLDGTGFCENIHLLDVRSEGWTRHTLYAVGGVDNVQIQGGFWTATNGENIRQVDKVPDTEGPHRFVSFPNASGRANNWVIKGTRFNRTIQAEPSLEYDSTKPIPEGFTSLRFDSLQNSSITNVAFKARRQETTKEHWSGRIVTDTPMVVVEKYSRRNTFEAPSRAAVDLLGDARANQIIALADGLEEDVPALWMSGGSDEIAGMPWMTGGSEERKVVGMHKYYDGGIRRTYVAPDGSTSLLNLGVQNVFNIDKPQIGDIAVHDGTGFKDRKPRMATYDGKSWLFFKLETEEHKE